MEKIKEETPESQGQRITWKPSMLNKDAILYWLEEQIKVMQVRESWGDKNINLRATLECYRFLEKLIKGGKWDA